MTQQPDLRWVRLAPLGVMPSPDVALDGRSFDWTDTARCVRASVDGAYLYLPDAAPARILRTTPARIALAPHESPEKPLIWMTHVMVLETGQVFAAATPRVPEALPLARLTLLGTVPPPAPALTGLAAGTRIATPDGPVRVEDLRPGDLVCTRDGPAQRLVDVSRIAPDKVPAQITLARNIISRDAPERPLSVAPGTLILGRNAIVSRMFKTPEILIHAERLIDLHGIKMWAKPGVAMYQLRCAMPQILLAQGVPVASTPHRGEEMADHARPIPPAARQKTLVLRMWDNGLRACEGSGPARTRTPRRRERNAARRAAVTAKMLPYAKAAPADFRVEAPS